MHRYWYKFNISSEQHPAGIMLMMVHGKYQVSPWGLNPGPPAQQAGILTTRPPAAYSCFDCPHQIWQEIILTLLLTPQIQLKNIFLSDRAWLILLHLLISTKLIRSEIGHGYIGSSTCLGTFKGQTEFVFIILIVFIIHLVISISILLLPSCV